jgi:MerR family transcriptional regulator/heat shock protein HspR
MMNKGGNGASDTLEKKISLRKKKGSYSISVVSEMFGVHQQTIRLYEKEGLISPSRSSGNTRKFTEEDVGQLEEVIYLTHKLGVNLAGVSIILKLKKKVKKMQDEMNALFDKAKANLDQESLSLKEDSQKKMQQLVQMKKNGTESRHGDVKKRLIRKLITLEQDEDKS